jgi:hypothetical protein
MKIISVGSSCSVAYNLQKQELRKEAYPFDWLKTDNLEKLINCLEHKFNNFLENIEIIRTSDKHEILEDNFIENKNNNENKENLVIKNDYDMLFYHDFNKDYNILEIKEKYNKRINRFLKITQSEKILFVRDELKINNLIHYEKLIKVLDSLCENYKLLVIIHNPKNKNLEKIKYINNKIIYYEDKNKFVNWKREDVFCDIFNNFIV